MPKWITKTVNKIVDTYNSVNNYFYYQMAAGSGKWGLDENGCSVVYITKDQSELYKTGSAFLTGELAGGAVGGAAKTVGSSLKAIKGASSSIFKSGRASIEAIESNSKVFSGKSADEIANMLREGGYNVTVEASKRSTSGAKIIKINNAGNGRNISQVQVSPGGGRHGANPYVKISTTDQGIIKIVDGIESTYKTDGAETATIIFTGRK